MTSKELLHKVHDEPFKPFRIRLADKRTFDILHPRMVMVGPERAVVVTRRAVDRYGRWFAADWTEVVLAEVTAIAAMRGKRANGSRKRA
jgi:hypothetical protein